MHHGGNTYKILKKKNIFHIQNIRLTIDVNKDGKNIEDLKQI